MTDELTPRELRELYLSPESHQQRLKELLESRRTTNPEELPVDSIDSIRVWVDGSHDPHLFPMFLVFNAFSSRLVHDPSWRTEAHQLMARHDLSPQARIIIENLAIQHISLKGKLVAEVAPQQIRYSQILSIAEARLGEREARRAAQTGDLPRLAVATGLDVQTLRDLRHAAHRNPIGESSELALSKLKALLSATDWSRLRSFLLAEIATGMSMMDTIPEGSTTDEINLEEKAQ